MSRAAVSAGWRVILIHAMMAWMIPVALGQHHADSLWSVWSDAAKSIDARVNALDLFARSRFGRTNPDSVLKYARIMDDLAQSKGAPVHRGKAMALRASGHLGKGESEPAVALLDSAIALFDAAGSKEEIMKSLNAVGRAQAMRGNLAQAVAGLTRALKIAESLGDSSMTARILGNLGAMYHERGDLDQAMDYYLQRLTIAEALQQKDILGEVICNIASIKHLRGGHEDALQGYSRALSLSREIGHHLLTANILHNMANLHQEQGQLEQALESFGQELALGMEIGDEACESSGRIGMAETQFLLGDLRSSLSNAQKSLELARRNGDIMLMRDAANVLFKVWKAKGNANEALLMHELFIELRDSVMSEENQAAMLTQKFQYDYEKKEALLIAEQEKKDAVTTESLRLKNLQRNAFIGGFGLMALLAGTFFFQRNRINREKKRSDELLLNILPEVVADELKEKGSADAVQFEQVTVLFTDFKGFTAMSEKVTAKQLVKDLHECFTAFDRICAKHGIEKIKTIGDAYMAAGGLPTPSATHARDAVRAALEMRDFIAEGKARKIAAGLPYFEIRIGIHTGPVVAGIVGVKKFAYDIWGDTVNTASRMESSGEPGQVNISEATYRLVVGAQLSVAGHATPRAADRSDGQPATDNGPLFNFTPRGKVQAKGKGEIEMYFVDGSQPV